MLFIQDSFSSLMNFVSWKWDGGKAMNLSHSTRVPCSIHASQALKILKIVKVLPLSKELII